MDKRGGQTDIWFKPLTPATVAVLLRVEFTPPTQNKPRTQSLCEMVHDCNCNGPQIIVNKLQRYVVASSNDRQHAVTVPNGMRMQP